MPGKNTLVIFSQDPDTTQRIRTALEQSPFEIAGWTDSIDSVYKILNQLAPDVLICNLDPVQESFSDILYHMKTISPHTKILLLQDQSDSGQVIDAIKSGASIFIPDSLDLDGLSEIIKTLLNNEIYLPAFVDENLLKAAQMEDQRPTTFPFQLTSQEHHILSGFSQGASLSQISQQLDIDEELVKAHTNNILHKIHFVDIARKHYQEIMSAFHESTPIKQ